MMHGDLTGAAALIVALTGAAALAGKGVAYLVARSEARIKKVDELLAGKDLEINVLKAAAVNKTTECEEVVKQRDHIQRQLARCLERVRPRPR